MRPILQARSSFGFVNSGYFSKQASFVLEHHCLPSVPLMALSADCTTPPTVTSVDCEAVRPYTKLLACTLPDGLEALGR